VLHCCCQPYMPAPVLLLWQWLPLVALLLLLLRP
jgi:hypothetical protein